MTSEQDLLSALAKTAFRLHGRLLAVGEELAASAGLTASLWLVLGSVLEAPRTVADIARDMTARGYTVFVLVYRLPGEGWDARP